jgi:ribosomal protein L37AE/L43A
MQRAIRRSLVGDLWLCRSLSEGKRPLGHAMALACVHFLVYAVLMSAGSQFSEASDRIKVTVPPAGQQSAEKLVGSLASTCNRGDFIGFMNHFTPSYGSRIRKRMEDAFIQHQPKIDIHQVTLLSEDEGRITFGVRYGWHDRNTAEMVVASKVTARKIEGQWKLDGETLKAVNRTGSATDYAERSGDAVVPAAWNPLNPPAHLIDPALEHLRGDIGIQPGRGCANGKCAVR